MVIRNRLPCFLIRVNSTATIGRTPFFCFSSRYNYLSMPANAKSQKLLFIQNFVSNPLAKLMTAFTAALIFAMAIVFFIKDPERTYFLYYFVPVGVPFVIFILDRFQTASEKHWIQWIIDLPVLVFSLARSITAIPVISGHALFLSYCLLSTATRTAKVAAAIVLLQVAYLKIFTWHDNTLYGGIAFGILAAVLYHLAGRFQFKKIESGNL
jgi:hypothetical protein